MTKHRRYQSTSDVEARAAGRTVPEPHVPLARFRSTGWVIAWIVLVSVAFAVLSAALGLF